MGGFFPPPGYRFIDRLDAGLGVLAGRQIVDLAAIQPIGDADLDLLKAVEDVEFGERQALNAAGAHSLAHQNGVEPAAAPWPSCDDAEFLAALTEGFADRVGLFSRKRSRADAGRVGLADAK